MRTDHLHALGLRDAGDRNPRRFDHIDLRVVDRAEARAFYERICVVLGFPYVEDGGEWICFNSVPYPAVGEYLAITEDRAHQASCVCHALWAESRDEVDRVAAALRAAGVPALEGPGMFYQGHYAVYFEDPSGNRFEVCYREYTHDFDPRIPPAKKD
jgi:catechol 2,3-dioxygenase-like lactoylglutathione lyase family enzyme